MNKIGVWNTAFLGDAVLTLPLLASLKAHFPGAELHFWVRHGLEGLFAGSSYLDGVHGFAKRGGERSAAAAWRLGRRLSREGYGLWISAHRSMRSGLVSHWSSIPERVGYRQPLYNLWCYTHTVDREFGRLEEIERLLKLLGPLGATPVTHWPELTLPTAAQERAEDIWREARGPVLGLHPGSTWPTKRWPASGFGRVLRLALDRGIQVALFAGPDELPVAREVLVHAGLDPERSHPQVLNLAGKLNLPELAACLGRVDCHVSNDSGPMHLAWIQRVPLVALFGPTTRSLGFTPRGDTTVVLERDLPCRPCGLHGGRGCPTGTHACLNEISAAEVWAAAAPLLGL